MTHVSHQMTVVTPGLQVSERAHDDEVCRARAGRAAGHVLRVASTC